MLMQGNKNMCAMAVLACMFVCYINKQTTYLHNIFSHNSYIHAQCIQKYLRIEDDFVVSSSHEKKTTKKKNEGRYA